MSLVWIWTIYALFGVTVFSLALLWAVRTRQFTELDRQRYIALRSEEPLERGPGSRPTRLDVYASLGLFGLAAGVFAAAIWIASRG